ncbi:hypothetical protein [Amycolatopsis sp. WGS_07]|uniref:hypothetical protein n=1 Tax=Amycolatopsis sp. WGS_07 TaxID=3076764 RepID=UPI0038738129
MDHRHPPNPPDDQPRPDGRRKHPQNPRKQRDNRPMPRSRSVRPITPAPHPNPHPTRLIRRRCDEGALGFCRTREGFFARCFTNADHLAAAGSGASYLSSRLVVGTVSIGCRAIGGFALVSDLLATSRTDYPGTLTFADLGASNRPTRSYLGNPRCADLLASSRNPISCPIASLATVYLSLADFFATSHNLANDYLSTGVADHLVASSPAASPILAADHLSAPVTDPLADNRSDISRLGNPAVSTGLATSRVTATSAIHTARRTTGTARATGAARAIRTSTIRTTGVPRTSISRRFGPIPHHGRPLSPHRSARSAWHPHCPPLPGAPGGAPRLACSV